MLGEIDGVGREAVQSSNIAALGYDPERQTLAVEFKSGDVFHYAPVSPELALDFYTSDSKGKFFHQMIRGRFKGQAMTGPCAVCGVKGEIGTLCATGDGGRHEERKPAHRRDESARQYV